MADANDEVVYENLEDYLRAQAQRGYATYSLHVIPAGSEVRIRLTPLGEADAICPAGVVDKNVLRPGRKAGWPIGKDTGEKA